MKQGLQSEGACCVLFDVLACARPAKDHPHTHLALPSISHWPMTHGIFHGYLCFNSIFLNIFSDLTLNIIIPSTWLLNSNILLVIVS